MSKVNEFTAEEKSEICGSFRGCKDPDTQISILADLYLRDESSIKAVLQEFNLWPVACNKPATQLALQRRPSSSHHMWSPSEISQILSMRAEGATCKEIAEVFDVSASAISQQIVKHKKLSQSDVIKASTAKTSQSTESNLNASSFCIDADIRTDVVLLLEKLKSLLCSDIKFDPIFDAYTFGRAVGELTSDIDAMIRRLNSRAE